MSELAEQLKNTEHDLVDVINTWDDFLERHKEELSDKIYDTLITENDVAYEKAISQENA